MTSGSSIYHELDILTLHLKKKRKEKKGKKNRNKMREGGKQCVPGKKQGVEERVLVGRRTNFRDTCVVQAVWYI